MDGGVLLIAILVIIGSSVYLYYEPKRNIKDSENDTNELFKGYSSIASAAVIGGFLSFFFLRFLQEIFSANGTDELIVIGVVVVSATICGCTGWIVKTIKECNNSGK